MVQTIFSEWDEEDLIELGLNVEAVARLSEVEQIDLIQMLALCLQESLTEE